MKRLAMALLFSLSASPTTFGPNGTWVGKVSDSRCGPSHKNGPATGGQVLNDAECVELCIESGAKFALVTDGGVYSIANQNFKGLRSNIGNTIQVDGGLEGTTITVTKITSVQKKGKTK
jgi:hypothetical protein